ncbi:MAG: hypothetical protein QM747_15630 [Nocardioides sp.]
MPLLVSALVTALAAGQLLGLAGSPATATGASGTGARSVAVHGTLLVVQPDTPGARREYGVALANGDIVRVRGAFGDARTGERFDGRLVLPGAVGSQVTAGDALREVDRRGLTLSLSGTPTLTAAPAATPTTHEQFVAALDNKGSLGQDDAQLLAHVSTVGGYWEGESGGAISGITVPATVTHYDTALSTTDCGLGNDFFDVVQEAADELPGFSFSGSDQLVLFVPPGCSSGSIVGEGTVGSSFASGGALVVKAGTAIEGTYAHETGHNYGFDHANARVGGTSMEYYGVYDVMGFALSGVNQLTALSTPFRVFQGITDSGEIQHVDLGNGKDPVEATATIRPRSDDSGLRSVEVTNPDTGESLYLDYRSGTGQDAGSFYAGSGALGSDHGTIHYAPGVLVTAARSGAGTDILVLDGQGDTSLQTGDSWSNASGSLTVSVTGIDGSGATVDVAYTPSAKAKKLASSRPTIHGSARVGKTLVAKHGHWTRGTTFSYAWYAGGKRLAHQTGHRLTLAKAQKGKRISVRVTGRKAGYAQASRRSARTAKVTAA